VPNKKPFIIFFVLVVAFFFLFFYKSEKQETNDTQFHKEEQQVEGGLTSNQSSIIVDAIVNKDIDFLISNASTFNFGCSQEEMGNYPGESMVEECKNQESFIAYTIGIIESSGAIVSKKQYEVFLEEFFEDDYFEFVKEYGKEDFLYLEENGTNLGFISSKNEKFLLIMVDQEGKIKVAYQDKPYLFESYIE